MYMQKQQNFSRRINQIFEEAQGDQDVEVMMTDIPKMGKVVNPWYETQVKDLEICKKDESCNEVLPTFCDLFVLLLTSLVLLANY